MKVNGKMIKRMEKVQHIYITKTIGTYSINDAVAYDGEWKDDKKDGKGKLHSYYYYNRKILLC